MSDQPPAAAAPLKVEAVLEVVLATAGRLVGGHGGSIMLLVGGDELEVVCSPENPAALGARVRLGEGVAGQVAQTCDAVLVSGRAGRRAKPVDSGMSVPLMHDGRLFGVLNVNAMAGREFGDHDLEAATAFARHAADALAEARLYEVGRREGEERPEAHLDAMLGHLSAAASVDFVERQRLAVVDVAEVAREVAAKIDASGRPTGVRGPASVRVVSRPEWIERVLHELIANGHAHGEPPVRVIFELTGPWVVMSVADSGPGIPPEERERVLEPFGRLDAALSKPGLGLGLTIARRLVEASGGSITIVDTPVGGAAIQVRLRPAA